ncbi:hypothetical protein Tco_0664947 [Tanacetum coccineum]
MSNSVQALFVLGPKPLSVYDLQLKHGLRYENPYTLKQAISKNPKLYDASYLYSSKVHVNIFKNIQKEFPEEVKAVMDAFESMERDLDATWKQNEILNDQLLEATLKHDVEKCVFMCSDSINDDSHNEIENIKRESIDVQENLRK